MNDTEPDSRHFLHLALTLAVSAHGKTLNKDRSLYILHPLRLMMEARSEEDKIVAILHDTIEDTDLTLDQLTICGFSTTITDALDHLTKRPAEKDGDDGYATFIQRVSQNPIALRVKLLDLYDNIDVTRLPFLGDWELLRTARYHRAINYLRGYLGEDALGAQ